MTYTYKYRMRLLAKFPLVEAQSPEHQVLLHVNMSLSLTAQYNLL